MSSNQHKGGCLFIGGVPCEWKMNDLYGIFCVYGNLLRIRIKVGYAFVEYFDYASAEAAIRHTCGGKNFSRRYVYFGLID